MKKVAVLVVLTVLFSVAFACGASAITTSGGAFVPPPGAELERFPIMRGPLSMKQMAQLGLRPVFLTEPLLAHNYVREWRAWAVYEIHEGTLVLVDEEGEVRYKADCGNRVASIVTPHAELLPVVEETAVQGSSMAQEGMISDQAFLVVLVVLGMATLAMILAWFLSGFIKNYMDKKEQAHDPAPVPTPIPAVVPSGGGEDKEIAMISIIPNVEEVGVRLNSPATRADVRRHGAEYLIRIYSS